MLPNAVTCPDHTKVKIKQIFVLCLPSLRLDMDPEGPPGRSPSTPGYVGIVFPTERDTLGTAAREKKTLPRSSSSAVSVQVDKIAVSWFPHVVTDNDNPQ